MDFGELVQTRRSVRGFKKEPVPRSLIEEVLEVAKRAPSSMNTQPWHVHVLSGEPLEQVCRRNMEEMIAGARDDKPMGQDWVLRGFRQFDALVSLVLTYDRVLDPGATCHFDLGALCRFCRVNSG